MRTTGLTQSLNVNVAVACSLQTAMLAKLVTPDLTPVEQDELLARWLRVIIDRKQIVDHVRHFDASPTL